MIKKYYAKDEDGNIYDNDTILVKVALDKLYPRARNAKESKNVTLGLRRAHVLGWLFSSKTLGEFREARKRATGLEDDGGWLRDYIKDRIVIVKKAPKR